MAVAAATILGPAGELIGRGEDIPPDWPQWFLADLAEHGAIAGEAADSAVGVPESVALAGTTDRGHEGT